MLLKEEVAARQPPTTQRTVHVQCYRAHIIHLFRCQRRGDEADARVVHVLVVVAVELVTGDDLARHRHERIIVADHRHFDLASLYLGLHQHLAVVLQGEVDGVLER